MKFFLSSRFRLSSSRLPFISSTMLFLAANSGWVSAATIANPSFEADTFTVFPGYISGNGPITGWTGVATNRVGLNPTTAANPSPFADNGTIPDGTKVAFVQSLNNETNTLSTTITGLTVGQSYRVTYQTNARNNNAPANTPNVTATAGTSSISMNVSPVNVIGGAGAYRPVGLSFTATAPTANLSISNMTAADTTVLVDNFKVLDGGTGWTVNPWNNDATSGINTGLTANRTYTHAINLGTTTGTVVNGVTFTGVGGANPAVAGSFSTSGLTGVFNNDTNNLTGAGGGSAILARDFLFRTGNSNATESITLNGLTAGQPYVFSVFGVGFDDALLRTATFDLNGDLLTVNENQFGNNNGIRLDYLYYPTATSQTINFTPTTNNASFHTYAFANALVPEPGRALFLIAGGLSLLFRRRCVA